jgi:hypothetical protein
MIEKKYKGTLDSLLKKGCINEEIYEIAKSTEIDKFLEPGEFEKNMQRMKNLAVGGLSEIQNLKLETTYLFLFIGLEETSEFNSLFNAVKNYYFDVKKELLKKE